MGGFMSSFVRICYLALPDLHATEPLDPDAEFQQREFERAIMEAIDTGDLEALRQLSDESRFTFWGALEMLSTKSPLMHRAASKGHSDIVQFLLDFGQDVDEIDSSGMTALHVACKRRRNSCIPLLLDHCRDIDKRDVWGRTPLIKALVYRNLDAAELLLERGANPNATDIYGMTPLSTAVDYNMMEMLRCLVLHGADVNLITQHPCRFSGPPLYLAINNQNLSMVQELLHLGANTQPRLQDYHGGAGQMLGPWQYLTFHTPNMSPTPNNLQHNNAVALAMSELLKRGEESNSVSVVCMEILMAVLAAHGYPLGPSPDVLIRVLINSKPPDFAKLLHKLQICSSCCSEEMTAAMLSPQGQDSSNRPVHLQQLSQRLRKPPRIVSSLQNQARRTARQALMASSHNVFWACQRLQCPPALKSLMLLRDIDRAFMPAFQRFGLFKPANAE